MDHTRTGRTADPLAALVDLSGHRWNNHVLLQLAAAKTPTRRKELATAIRRACDGRPDDVQVGRALKQLTAQRLVRPVTTADQKQYQLTTQGHQRANLLRRMLHILHRGPEADQRPAPVNHTHLPAGDTSER